MEIEVNKSYRRRDGVKVTLMIRLPEIGTFKGDDGAWRYIDGRVDKGFPNHHMDLVAEWVEPATPDADGWITWAGGECPVPGDTVVEVRVRDGARDTNRADTWFVCWKNDNMPEDIVAYRVVMHAAPKVSEPAALPVTMEPDASDIRGIGMKYDGGKPRVDLVLSGFPRALLAVAEVATFGAAKYAEDSWATVPEGVKRYTSAKDRHRLQGAVERDDPETKLRHAAHEAWNALAVLELALRAEADQ